MYDGISLLKRTTGASAAELMTRTGSVVTLEVAKQGAIYHGLATLLNQPSPMMQRVNVSDFADDDDDGGDTDTDSSRH
ncbi:hypothetical protein INR49_019307 [Caranx melampygus]|nr:hypothetical protein INR49_019307 [Caranx melampygus]